MKVFPSSHERLITGVLLAFALGALLGLLTHIGKDQPEVVVTAFATLFAAFFGAWYAFKKQNQHEDLKQVRRNVEAANRAIFTVHTLWEIQKSYQQQAAPSLEHRIACWLLLDPTPIINFGRTRFDVEHLDFLLSSQHVSVFRDLLQMERRYEIFRQLIERRNELVLNKLRPTIEILGITDLKPSDIPVIESKLGPALSSDLKSTTEHIVKFVDEDITSLEELYPRLHAAVTRMYPDQEFVTINFGD